MLDLELPHSFEIVLAMVTHLLCESISIFEQLPFLTTWGRPTGILSPLGAQNN